MNNASVVIDGGSYMTRVGLTPSSGDIITSSSEGNDIPMLCFPSVIGLPRIKPVIGTVRDYHVGDEAFAKRGVLQLTNPMNKGRISDWDDMEKIWNFTLTELKVREEEEANTIGECVLMSYSPLSTVEEREKMVEIMIEKLGVPAVCLENQACLALRASGRESGLVLDIGHTVTSVVPIVEGKVLKEGVVSLDFGGHNLDEYLCRLLSEKGLIFSRVDWSIVRDIKERVCNVSQDFESDIKAPTAKLYETPDGSEISLDSECIQCPEALFHPEIIAKGWDCGSPTCLNDSYQFNPTGIQSNDGIHIAVHKSIMSCDESVRDTLRSNIIIVGGSAKFKGISQRLTKELVKLAPTNNFQVEEPLGSNRSFTGGMMLASLPSFPSMCLTRAEYKECGASAVQRKFL